MKALTPDFSPSLLHPFYFVRKNLLDGIAQNAPELSGKLLDFGCGSKPYRSLFKVDEYIGVDFINEGHPHENEHVDFFYDGEKIPFPDEYFDSILCSEVFEHVFNLDHILKELNRVLKKNGKILITCPFVWNEHEVPHDYARYSIFALKDMLGKSRFEIISYTKTGNYLTALSQLWVLYFYTVFQKKASKFFLFRWLYKFFFVLIPNCTGILLGAIFPVNKTLYLNNIVLAKKS